MKFEAIFIILLVFFGCSSNNNEPCEWEENKFYAEVDSIQHSGKNENGDSTFIIWVSFTSGSLSNELQDLGKLRDIEFTREKINSNKALIGNSYSGLINDVIKGNCESPIISFDQKRR